MGPKAAIFDLDGTLLDTLGDLAEAGNRVLKLHGYPAHPVEKYRYFVGDGLQVLMTRILPQGASESQIAEGCEAFETVYKEIWDRTSCPYPGITRMLEELNELPLKLAVLSNKPHEFTQIYIQRFFPEIPFAEVFGQRSGVPKKPDPAGAYEIASGLGIPPEDCLYIGDTAVDMQTGKSAGMFTMGVLWGFRDEHELRENRADLIVSRPMEIVEHVLSTR